MKQLYLLLTGIFFYNLTVFAQYTGGSGDGYASLSSTAGWASEAASIITANMDTITVNGADTAVVTVQLKDAGGVNLTTGGDLVVLSATIGSLSAVADNNNGTYTARFTSANPGTAVITGTLNGAPMVDSDTIIAKGITLKLTAKVFLQGPFNTGTGVMNTTLNTGGTLSSHFIDTPVPFAAVDSIKLEIRDSVSAAQSTIRAYAAAWLLSDGTIRSFSDTTKSNVELAGVSGSYYIVVRHRNHLAIMSAASVAFASDSAGYDFTTGQTQAYGINPMKDLDGVRFGMWTGDVNGDGVVKYNLANNDRLLIYNRIGNAGFNVTVGGYYNEDLNLDGVAKYNLANNDRLLIYNVLGNGGFNVTKVTQVPN